MFTGIIQSTGQVKQKLTVGDGIRMQVLSPGFFASCKEGDSVANNGVCLTIEECDLDTAWFSLVHQTVSVTAFQQIKEQDLVNLELPCTGNSLLGGHYVMGHVDGVAEVEEIISREHGCEVLLKIPAESRKYIIDKGSITLNGISLTIAEKRSEGIRIAIIPETLEKTNLHNWASGTLVNFEVDVLGKYVESLVKDQLEAMLQQQKENL